MTRPAANPAARPARHVPRGFVATFHPGELNRCPACHATSWHVGRSSAECAVCATAIPFAVPASNC